MTRWRWIALLFSCAVFGFAMAESLIGAWDHQVVWAVILSALVFLMAVMALCGAELGSAELIRHQKIAQATLAELRKLRDGEAEEKRDA